MKVVKRWGWRDISMARRLATAIAVDAMGREPSSYRSWHHTATDGHLALSLMPSYCAAISASLISINSDTSRVALKGWLLGGIHHGGVAIASRDRRNCFKPPLTVVRLAIDDDADDRVI